MKYLALILALAVSTTAQSPYLVPQGANLSTATKNQNVSNFVGTLQYGLVAAAIPETYPIFTNFVMRARSQTISGANTFSGANVFSNASQIFTLGSIRSSYISNAPSIYVTNLFATNAAFGGTFTMQNTGPEISFKDTNGGTDEKYTVLTADSSVFEVAFKSDDLSQQDLIFSVDRVGYEAAGMNIFTTLTAPMIYSTILSNSILTNVTIGATAALVEGPFGTSGGNVGITNNAAVLTFNDSGGTTDDKISKWVADGDAFYLGFYNDAGSLVTVPVSFPRVAGVPGTIDFNGDVNFSGNTTVEGDAAFEGSSSTAGIITAGSSAPTPPASADIGVYIMDGTAPSADPTTGTYLWSESGIPKYRTSTSSEGSGGDNRIHNRTSTTAGAGTDYSFTTSTAALDFGTTDPSITVPTAGTYLFLADVSITNGGTANDEYRLKIRNQTSSTDLVSDAIISYLPASQSGFVTLQATATCSASDVVAIWGHNNTAARGTANSARTRLRYVRLY